jgi:hypothetical protein
MVEPQTLRTCESITPDDFPEKSVGFGGLQTIGKLHLAAILFTLYRGAGFSLQIAHPPPSGSRNRNGDSEKTNLPYLGRLYTDRLGATSFITAFQPSERRRLSI